MLYINTGENNGGQVPKESLITYQNVEEWFKNRSFLNGRISEKSKTTHEKLLYFFEEFDSRCLFEDSDIIVLDKPAHVVSHYASDTNPIGVVEVARYMRTSNDIQLAHRLDANTTGIIILTKNDEAYKGMKAQFASKEASGLKKVYTAFLDGHFPHNDFVTIVLPLLCIGNMMKVASQDEIDILKNTQRIKWSETRIKALQRAKDRNGKLRTFVEVEIITGRMHQIRIVTSHLNFPVIGDTLYNRISGNDAPRQLLHASQITFFHPTTGESMTFSANFPNDFFHYGRGLKLIN